LAATVDLGTLGNASAPHALRSAWGTARDAAFGYNSLFVLRADGTLSTSGRNEHLELGLGDQPFGTQVDGPANVLASAGVPLAGITQMVSTNVQVSLALQDGLIMVWGAGNQPLKGAEFLATGYPQRLPGSGSGWRALSASHDHALAIAANGAVYSWGRGLRGALGNGVDGGSILAPNLVTVPWGRPARAPRAVRRWPIPHRPPPCLHRPPPPACTAAPR
jgi:alpha-tubulin suppressor-like RCC1 family protein